MDIVSSDTPNDNHINEKQCTNPDCLNPWLPATTEYFYRMKASKDGLTSRCKECIKQQQNARYRRPEVRERVREYRRTPQGREKRKTTQRNYRRSPGAKAIKRERKREYKRRPEVKRKHAEYFHEYSRRPEVREKMREYRQKEGRAKKNVRDARRRARKQSVQGAHTHEQIANLLKQQKYRCYYCGNKFEKQNGKYLYHVDHTFPLSRVAGTDIPANDIGYLVLACHSCNESKGSKFPWEWSEGGRLL